MPRNLPITIVHSPTEPDTPVAPPGHADAASPPRRRPKVILAPESGNGDDSELRALLRQRLRAIALVVAAANVINVVQYVLAFAGNAEPNYLTYILQSYLRTLNHLHVVVYVVIAVFVSRWPPRSLLTLRICEAVIFFGGINYTATYHCRVLNVSGWLPEVFRFGSLLPTSLSLNWFFIIVGYGTLIPNTGRRCATVVSLTALFAVALSFGSLLANETPVGEAMQFLLTFVLWMMYAVVIAIVGSHRLEKLRREASVARQLGQYRLTERLGAGGMGEVYLAEHLLLRRPCAVKLILPEWAGDPRHLQRFEREVQTTATLSHPNTVQIYDYGHAEDGTFYYAMEYLPGLTLEELVEQHGPLPPGRVIHFVHQLCGSLTEAHGIGLIHRDLKPGNVMVCERGGVYDVAKLLDFGLVLPQRELQDGKLTQEGALAGTPTYMSPEQGSGQTHLDGRSDIYSLGCLMYFLLTGQPPFVDPSVVKVLAAHLYETPEPLSRRVDVPADLEAIVQRCLAKNPVDRFPSVEALGVALLQCASHEQWSSSEAATWWRSVATDRS